MKKAIIVDLDNCLFDSRPIEKYFPRNTKDRKQWDKYHKHYNKCKINEWCVDLIKRFAIPKENGACYYTVLFVTGREARKQCINDTLDMINMAFSIPSSREQCIDDAFTDPGYHFRLFMRPNDCFKPDHEVKRDIYTSCIKDRFDVLFAIDDRKENIDMWLNFGIPCLQCYQV